MSNADQVKEEIGSVFDKLPNKVQVQNIVD